MSTKKLKEFNFNNLSKQSGLPKKYLRAFFYNVENAKGDDTLRVDELAAYLIFLNSKGIFTKKVVSDLHLSYVKSKDFSLLENYLKSKKLHKEFQSFMTQEGVGHGVVDT